MGFFQIVDTSVAECTNEVTDVIYSNTGYHSTDIPKQTVDQQVLAAKWSFAVQMFYHPMMGAIRASIIAFLFRVKDSRRHINIALHIVCKL